MGKKASGAELKTVSRYPTTDRKKKRLADIVYVTVMGTAFAAIMAAMIFMPRNGESELEQRKLAEFPELTSKAIFDGSFMEDVTLFFRDNVPMRDKLMNIASQLQEYTGFRSHDIKLHNVAIAEAETMPEETETAAVTETTAAAVTETDDKQNVPYGGADGNFRA